jgi:hypothetical protein
LWLPLTFFLKLHPVPYDPDPPAAVIVVAGCNSHKISDKEFHVDVYQYFHGHVNVLAALDCVYPPNNRRFQNIGMPHENVNSFLASSILAPATPSSATSPAKRVPLLLFDIQFLNIPPASAAVSVKGAFTFLLPCIILCWHCFSPKILALVLNPARRHQLPSSSCR